MTSKKRPSSTCESHKAQRPRTSPWTSAEDTTIQRLRRTTPPSSWIDIATAVNALPPGGRSVESVKMRFYRVLKHDDVSGDPLTDVEREVLRNAVRDVESMNDKWWFVAARYAELRKGKGEGEAREMGKIAAKRWWGAVKDEESGKNGKNGKKE